MGYTDSDQRRKAVALMGDNNMKISEEKVAHVTNFLDEYFHSYSDMAPEGRAACFIHFTYRELYVQYYIPYCADLLTFRKFPVADTDFYRIR